MTKSWSARTLIEMVTGLKLASPESIEKRIVALPTKRGQGLVVSMSVPGEIVLI